MLLSGYAGAYGLRTPVAPAHQRLRPGHAPQGQLRPAPDARGGRGRRRRGVRRRAPAPRPRPRRRRRPRVRGRGRSAGPAARSSSAAAPPTRCSTLVEAAREATGRPIAVEHVPAKPGEMPAVVVDVVAGPAPGLVEPRGHPGRRAPHGVGRLRACRDAPEHVLAHAVGRALARHWLFGWLLVSGSASRSASPSDGRLSAVWHVVGLRGRRRGVRRLRALGRPGAGSPPLADAAGRCSDDRMLVDQDLRAVGVPARRVRAVWSLSRFGDRSTRPAPGCRGSRPRHRSAAGLAAGVAVVVGRPRGRRRSTSPGLPRWADRSPGRGGWPRSGVGRSDLGRPCGSPAWRPWRSGSPARPRRGDLVARRPAPSASPRCCAGGAARPPPAPSRTTWTRRRWRTSTQRCGAPRLGPVVIVIAAYNEAEGIPAVLDDAAGRGRAGCTPTSWSSTTAAPTAPRRRWRGSRALVVTCPANRGQGAALRLGYRIAREHGRDVRRHHRRRRAVRRRPTSRACSSRSSTGGPTSSPARASSATSRPATGYAGSACTSSPGSPAS